MRCPRLLLATLTLLPCFAQHQSDLATSKDGSVLYFTHHPVGAASSKIYRWSQRSGVELFADRPDIAQLPPHFGQHLYGAQAIAGDTVTYHAEPLCFTGMGPGFNDCTIGETTLVIPGSAPFSVPGFLLVSPSGRYGLFSPYGRGALLTDFYTGEEIEIDFQQFGRIAEVTPPFGINTRAIANNGSFLMIPAGSAGVVLWTRAGIVTLPIPANSTTSSTSISADGSTVAASFRDPSEPADRSGGAPSYVIQIATGRRSRFPGPVSLSDDGQTVAYVSNSIFTPDSQVFVARRDGTGARQITNHPEGIRGAILSGDGRFLFAVLSQLPLGATSLQRYDLTTGEVLDIPGVP